MAKSRETWGKKETAKRKEKKRKDKVKKREERINSREEKSPEDMIAYVDEYGNITDTPPDPEEKKKVKPEDIIIGTPKRDDLKPESKIREGIVSHYNDSKGYGFIRDIISGESVFFHVNAVLEPVVVDNRVSFEVESRPKGKCALVVKPIRTSG
jgi:cold shock CspA family protein